MGKAHKELAQFMITTANDPNTANEGALIKVGGVNERGFTRGRVFIGHLTTYKTIPGHPGRAGRREHRQDFCGDDQGQGVPGCTIPFLLESRIGRRQSQPLINFSFFLFGALDFFIFFCVCVCVFRRCRKLYLPKFSNGYFFFSFFLGQSQLYKTRYRSFFGSGLQAL